MLTFSKNDKFHCGYVGERLYSREIHSTVFRVKHFAVCHLKMERERNTLVNLAKIASHFITSATFP